MIPTPYLKPFSTQGGTLYVFPSVSKDLTRTLVSNDYEFKFSHFACLNLPDISSGNNLEDSDADKKLYISTLMGDHGPDNTEIGWTDRGIQNAIAENLQNYVMNFETLLLNSDTYDSTILTTVSEKVFWNWLQKVGGITFTEGGTTEEFNNYTDRTVQYIGNIDVMNTVEVNGDVFEELYIHIPSSVGASTSVYFRTGGMTDNKNYRDKRYSIREILNKPGETGEFIIGRGNSPVTPFELQAYSFVDDDSGDNIYIGDIGHTIDFRDSSYPDGINNMNSKSLEDFEFNAILIYYDIFEKTSTPGVKRTATNLYGILFLDNVTSSGSTDSVKGYIQRYPKQKETHYENGNSYALKIDLKVDTIGDTTYTPTVDFVDPNSGVSMTLYVKALEQLQKCIDLFYTQKNDIVKLNERISNVENIVMGIDTISSIKEELKRLNNLYDSYSIVDTPTLLGLIDENSKKIDSIIKGEKNIKLQYDTDVIQPGAGINIEKNQNKIVINSAQKYSMNVVTYNGNQITPDNRMETIAETNNDKKLSTTLCPGENLMVIYMEDKGDRVSDFIINIDDSDSPWSIGQSLKIYFTCADGSFRFDSDAAISTGIIIKPTANVTLSISALEFEGNNFIEIICVDDNNFIYLIK